jgi:hypothetical protein
MAIKIQGDTVIFDNKVFRPAQLTTAERDAISSPLAGMLIYNTDINSVEGYNGTAWNSIGGGGGASAINDLTDGVADATQVGLGTGALVTSTGTDNTAVGICALNTNTTGSCNTAMGRDSLRCNTTGSNNTAQGFASLCSNTSGSCNTAVGAYSLLFNTTGSNNTAQGFASLSSNTTGFSNTAQGTFSLRFNTTGNLNTAVGRNSASTLTTGSNVTALGYNAQPSSATATNEITLGDTNVTNLRCNDTTISSLSDERDKDNIKDLNWGLEFIKDLRPVKFDWNRRDRTMQGQKDLGFIAQELDTVEEKYQSHPYTRLVHKENPNRWEADPMKTYPILVKAVQELSKRLDDLEKG